MKSLCLRMISCITLLSGCRQAGDQLVAMAPDSKPLIELQAHTIDSNAGSYKIGWMISGATFPVNEPCGLVFAIFDAQTGKVFADVNAVVDAAMPAHGHGLNSRPVVTRNVDGSFTVQGLTLHMAGHWELYFDITRGNLTERAQLDLDLE